MKEHDEADAPDELLLAGLAQGLDPGPEVEERIVSALRRRGLVRAPGVRSRSWSRLAAAAAAALALFAAGLGVGRGLASRVVASPAEPRFALFLLRGSERVPEPAEEEAARVAEYRGWARGLAGKGRFVSGEKLEDEARQLGSPQAGASSPAEEIRGFFVISARDFGEALAIARGCPHLRHGGRILVRPIART